MNDPILALGNAARDCLASKTGFICHKVMHKLGSKLDTLHACLLLMLFVVFSTYFLWIMFFNMKGM